MDIKALLDQTLKAVRTENSSIVFERCIVCEHKGHNQYGQSLNCQCFCHPMREYLRALEKGQATSDTTELRDALKEMALIVRGLEDKRDLLTQENEQLRRDLEEATAPPARGKKGK